MDVKVTLKPGQQGTKRLASQFGDRLVCVRYRYDAKRCRRFETAELIVDEQLWLERPRLLGLGRSDPPPLAPVLVKIAFDEYELRARAKQRGAVWMPAEKLRRMRYDDVVDLGLVPGLSASRTRIRR